MKTLLEIGKTVFDSALFGDLEGKVVKIGTSVSYPLIVRFGNTDVAYTLDGRHHEDFNPTLSMQPYDKLSDIVPVWEEEEVWGIFWDDEYDTKIYGQMIKSDNKDYPYRHKGELCYKHFKETGKLI